MTVRRPFGQQPDFYSLTFTNNRTVLLQINLTVAVSNNPAISYSFSNGRRRDRASGDKFGRESVLAEIAFASTYMVRPAEDAPN